MVDFKICILLLFVFACDINSKILPDYVPTCTRKEKDYALCLRNTFEFLRPYFAKGIPEIRMPALNPLEIPNITIERYEPLLELKAKLDNFKVYGMHAFQYNYLKADIKNKYKGEYSLVYPKLYVTTDYDLSGRFIGYPLGGRGKFEGNYTTLAATRKLTFKVVKRKGIKHLALDTFHTSLRIEDAFNKIHDNGATAFLAEAVVKFMNENPRLTLDIYNPLVVEATNVIYRAISKRILSKIPLSELLPDE